MERKRIYSLLCHVKYEDGREYSYLERMSDDEELLKGLLDTMYSDAEHHRDGKVFTPSDPEWIDTDVLKIIATTYCGYIQMKCTHIYSISWNWEQNINSKQIWLDY